MLDQEKQMNFWLSRRVKNGVKNGVKHVVEILKTVVKNSVENGVKQRCVKQLCETRMKL